MPQRRGSLPCSQMSGSAWHEGEAALQREAGISEVFAAHMGLAIRDHLREPERLCFPQLSLVVIGTVDAHGLPRATLQAGAPGFLSTPRKPTLRVIRTRDDVDPVERGLQAGHAVGVLGIELSTRRRNRINGRLRGVGKRGYTSRWSRASATVRASSGRGSTFSRIRRGPYPREGLIPFSAWTPMRQPWSQAQIPVSWQAMRTCGTGGDIWMCRTAVGQPAS